MNKVSFCNLQCQTYNNDHTRLTAIFQDNPGKPVPERLHSGF